DLRVLARHRQGDGESLVQRGHLVAREVGPEDVDVDGEGAGGVAVVEGHRAAPDERHAQQSTASTLDLSLCRLGTGRQSAPSRLEEPANDTAVPSRKLRPEAHGAAASRRGPVSTAKGSDGRQSWPWWPSPWPWATASTNFGGGGGATPGAACWASPPLRAPT